jgi:hypothetical protein
MKCVWRERLEGRRDKDRGSVNKDESDVVTVSKYLKHCSPTSQDRVRQNKAACTQQKRSVSSQQMCSTATVE